MTLKPEEVRWVAHLARLECAEEEIKLFTAQLNEIVAYVNQLQEVNTEGVEPLSHCLPISNVFRADEPGVSLTVDEALKNAPARKGEFYSVPAVLE
ncbi:MAG: Asp-tRNA(Asn)/Glu-tRNA(Gln) amidotransferase subunit GatC [Gemmatales bacterium]|nr:Asp-tRNA(Asn)/Glu-tRNA(Gln) amidotransferase subunit GatC [Gemmatales bacterium]MDW8223214.1 Asp-tRNA(Asn)/Glu-tRNA(Gln) amidotransferase subunit GatC [Gemmatales bacterium]